MCLGDAGGGGLICEHDRDRSMGVGGESGVGAGGGVCDVLDVGFLGVGVIEEHSWRRTVQYSCFCIG